MRVPSKNHGVMIGITAFWFAALLFSACGGSSLQDREDCGPHGEWVDGQCVCEPGYVPQGDTCVAVADGDTDADTPDGDKPDGDKPDGDKPDGDSDGDVIIPDGDQVDGDATDGDQDTPPCTCPVLDANFCVDPEIPNPANYQIVELRPGSKPGCTLVVSVRTGLTVTVDEYSCPANERIVLPSLGCTLFYAAGDGVVRMVCGDYQYTFAVSFCQAAPDGDDDADGDKPDGDTDGDQSDGDQPDGDTDGDQPDGDTDGDQPDGDTDGDKPDGDQTDGDTDGDEPDGDEPDGDEPDGDEPDGDVDGDQEQPAVCSWDEDCAEYHYCDISQSPWRCVSGCHPTTRPCQPGYTCTTHGICESSGEDPICTAATEEAVCGYGYYCEIQSGETGLCRHDCWNDGDCQDGFVCAVPRGRCEPLGGCETDEECEPQWFCNISALCQQGCANATQCGFNQSCTAHGRCVDNTTDGDEDPPKTCTDGTVVADCGTGYFCLGGFCHQECATTSYCQTMYTPDFICNEFGMCVRELICQTHDDCAPAGYPRHYCHEGMCYQNCADDAACVSQYGSGFGCNEYGWCERVETDEDSGGIVCSMDTHCPQGQYCDLPTSGCVSDCSSHEQCSHLGPTAYCDTARGRCETIPDPDGDTTDQEGSIFCTQDEDCPQYWYCQTHTQNCINSCVACPSTWDCREGVCYPPDCDGDECPPDGDLDIEDINQPCTTIADCPSWYYCDTDGWCKQECITGCPAGTTCSLVEYRCVPVADGDEDLPDTEDACSPFVSCPAGHYCDVVDWRCKQDCVRKQDCGPGFVCTVNGRCDFNTPPCVHDDECPKGTRCQEDNWRCMADCFEDAHCAAGYFCSDRGLCLPNGTTPDPAVFPSCVYNSDCPSLSFCDFDVCRTTCFPTIYGCAEGLICNDWGQCVVPGTDGDVDGDEDGDLDGDEDGDTEQEQNFDDLICETRAKCPYSSDCLPDPLGGPNKTCQTECFADWHCSGGEVCDCLGRCVATLPDPSICTGFRSCLGDGDCPSLMHCGGGYCRMECAIYPSLGLDFGCREFYACSERGYCELDVDGDEDGPIDPILCTDDGDCPYHSYCLDPGGGNDPRCYAQCTQDFHCPPGLYCNNRGLCDPSSGPWDDGLGYLSCTQDADCQSLAYCTPQNYCRADCVSVLNLNCEAGICYKGRCLAK